MRALWINRTNASWIDAMGEGPTWIFKSFSELATFDPEHVDQDGCIDRFASDILVYYNWLLSILYTTPY